MVGMHVCERAFVCLPFILLCFSFPLKVETFGSMEREEKVKFILEQMRLCMTKKDFIRTQIISKKISVKFFTDKSDLVQVGVCACVRVCVRACVHMLVGVCVLVGVVLVGVCAC